MTKKYRISYWTSAFISLFLNLFPILFFTIKAIINADLTYEKIALTGTVLIVAIMTLLSITNKIVLRSKLWIFLIALYICLDSIMEPLIWIASCQVLDELICSPIKGHFKSQLTIHKAIDKRLA